MRISTRYKKTQEHLKAIQSLWPMAVVEQEIELYFQKQLIEDILELVGKQSYTLQLFTEMERSKEEPEKEKQLLNEENKE